MRSSRSAWATSCRWRSTYTSSRRVIIVIPVIVILVIVILVIVILVAMVVLVAGEPNAPTRRRRVDGPLLAFRVFRVFRGVPRVISRVVPLVAPRVVPRVRCSRRGDERRRRRSAARHRDDARRRETARDPVPSRTRRPCPPTARLPRVSASSARAAALWARHQPARRERDARAFGRRGIGGSGSWWRRRNPIPAVTRILKSCVRRVKISDDEVRGSGSRRRVTRAPVTAAALV